MRTSWAIGTRLALTALWLSACAMTGCARVHSDGISGLTEVQPDALGARDTMQQPEILHRVGIQLYRVRVGERELPYTVYTPFEIPRGQRPAKLPVIVFLHGRGESGTDGLKPVAQGLLRAVCFNPERWPAIIIAPQKPDQGKLWPEYDELVMAALREVLNSRACDPDRVYLTGLSQGGHGTFALGAAHSETWAALAPVCGWTTDEGVPGKLAALPIWAFHGDADDIIKPAGTIDTIAAVIAARARGARAGPEPKMTIYPGVNHNSWDRAYGEEQLPKWLFAQRRTP